MKTKKLLSVFAFATVLTVGGVVLAACGAKTIKANTGSFNTVGLETIDGRDHAWKANEDTQAIVINAKFNLKVKAFAEAKTVAVVFKVETEVKDATTQLISFGTEEAGDAGQIYDFLNNGDEATDIFGKFMVGTVAKDAGYTGFAGPSAGRQTEANKAFTWGKTIDQQAQFFANKEGTYKVTAYVVDLTETEATDADGQKTTEQKGNVLAKQTLTFKAVEKAANGGTETPE